MSRSTAKIEIEDELQAYCDRVRRKRRKKPDLRNKLEAPPACRIEIPTYWEAVLKRIELKDIGDHQFDRLVQDAAGNIFVACQLSAAVLDPIEPADIGPDDVPNLVLGGGYFVARQPNAKSADEAVWLRTSGKKAVQEFGRLRLEVDVVEFAPFEPLKDMPSGAARLAEKAWSEFRADVIERVVTLPDFQPEPTLVFPPPARLAPTPTETLGEAAEADATAAVASGAAFDVEHWDDMLRDLSIRPVRNRLLAAGIDLPVPCDSAYEKTWWSDIEIDRRCREGANLTCAVSELFCDKIKRRVEESKDGLSKREVIKDLTRTVQAGRSRRRGQDRHPVAPEIRSEATAYFLPPNLDEILKGAWHFARLAAGVKAARHYIEKIKDTLTARISIASESETEHADNVGKRTELADLENRLARYSAVDDRDISAVLQWEPAWLRTMLSGQTAEILAVLEDIVSSAGPVAGRGAA